MITVREAVTEYLYAKRDLRAKTLTWYEYKLRHFTAWCEQQNLTLEQIKPTTVRHFLSQYDARSSYTKHGYAQVVKGFLSWCSKEEDFEDAVKERSVTRIELPTVAQTQITIYTAEEISALFAACEKEETDTLKIRGKALLSVLIDTGARASELCFDPKRPQEKTGLRMEDLFLSLVIVTSWCTEKETSVGRSG